MIDDFLAAAGRDDDGRLLRAGREEAQKGGNLASKGNPLHERVSLTAGTLMLGRRNPAVVATVLVDGGQSEPWRSLLTRSAARC